VVPFVGLLGAAPVLTVDEREITGVFTVPMAAIAALERRIERARPDGSVWVGWAYDTPDGTVWGATGQMVHSLLLVAECATS
jgi:hypothetical protein